MNHLFETAPTSNSSECDHAEHIEFAPKRKHSAESFPTVFGPNPGNVVMTATRGASDLTGILYRLSIKEDRTDEESDNKRRKTSTKELSPNNNDITNYEITQTFVDPLVSQLTTPSSDPNSNTPLATSSTTTSSESPKPTNCNPFHRTLSEQSDVSLESTYSFSSCSSSYAGLDCRIDPLAHHNARLEEMRRYFARNEAWTRYQRRKYLYALTEEYANVGARWLEEFPSDLWDTKAEEEAGCSRMYADQYAEEVTKVHAETGFYDKAGCEELYAAPKFDEARESAKVVGWVEARQEYLFLKDEWRVGGGEWGSASEVVEEERGPRDEVL
jgi:hypothetical protein